MSYQMAEYKNVEPGNDASAAEQVAQEIKAIGGDVKRLADDVNRRLKDFQDKLDRAEKGGLDAVKAEELNKLRTEVLAKSEALEAASVKRLDQIETAMKRTPLGGDGGEVEVKALKHFNRDVMVASGSFKDGRQVGDLVSLDSYQAYKAAINSYLRKGEKIMSAEEYKALTVGSDPAGGYLVTPFVSDKVVALQYETSPIRQVATVITIGTDAYEYYTDLDDLDVESAGETDARGETNTPDIGKGTITVHEKVAKPKATTKLLEDASIDAEAWLADKLGRKFSRETNRDYTRGSGIKEARGFVTYPAGTAWGQIEQCNTGSATGATFEGLTRLKFCLKEFYHSRAVWLMNRQMVAACMLIKDGDGRYIFASANQQAGFPMSLMGYTLRMAADLPVPASGALSIAFGDFYEGYTIVDRHGIRTLRDPYHSKPYVEFYTTMRTGGDVTNFEAIKLGKCATL